MSDDDETVVMGRVTPPPPRIVVKKPRPAKNPFVVETELSHHEVCGEVISFRIMGTPQAQARGRSRILPGGRIIVYDPMKKTRDKLTLAMKESLEAAMVEQLSTHDNLPFFEDGNKVTMNCCFYIKDMRKDLDNLLKFLMDAMKDAIYVDDKWLFQAVLDKVVIQGALAEHCIVQLTKLP